MSDASIVDFMDKVNELIRNGFRMKGLIRSQDAKEAATLFTAKLEKDGVQYSYDSLGRWYTLNQES